jgi:hypothetical protein
VHCHGVTSVLQYILAVLCSEQENMVTVVDNVLYMKRIHIAYGEISNGEQHGYVSRATHGLLYF